jgi:hypothetical protein
MVDVIQLHGIAMVHVRASQPVSYGSMAAWLVDQVPSVSKSNVRDILNAWITLATACEEITVCIEDNVRIIDLP